MKVAPSARIPANKVSRRVDFFDSAARNAHALAGRPVRALC
jgi:hypothetical protein